MAILKKVEIHWLVADPKRGKKFQGKDSNPEKWSVQFRVFDKAERDRLAKEFGFNFKTEEKEDGSGVYYKTTLSAFTRDTEGNLNRPITVILGNGEPVDPNTVGNGSIANISFIVKGKGDDATRRLVGVQLLKHIVRKNDSEFELTEDFEVVAPADDGLDDEIVY